MVDEYPPFRLDMGGDDPGTTKLHEPVPAGPGTPERLSRQPGQAGQPPARMTAGRVIALVVGIVVTLASVAGLAVGGALAWLDEGRRDSAGFVTSGQVAMSTTGYALTSENFRIDVGAATVPRDWFGDVRIRVASTDGVPVFVGLARSADVEAYLAGVGYSTVRSIGTNRTKYVDHAGGAPASAPAALEIWRVKASGPGEQTITWPVENGDWTLVVMAADGSANIGVRADVGATAPALEWAWIVVLASAGLTLLLGVFLVVLAVVRRPQPGPSALQQPPVPPME
jgi:hypothetical protein